MSLTLAEARARAAEISDVSYDLDLDLRGHGQGTFGCRTRVRFTTSVPETFLELSRAEGLRVRVDGRAVEPAYDGRRIRLVDLPLGVPVEVEVSGRLPYVNDGDGMHLVTDPADGATYISAYLGMDISQRVFACFDQVDLKAPVTLAVSAEPGWTVLANGRPTGSGPGPETGRWTFATTPPIPPDQVVVCAGPWHSVTWEHAGLPFGWHSRASLAADLDRDAEELVRTTNACFDHYAGLFEEPYAFDSYDQVLVPGQNWGALETPGCVTYRDEYLPRGRTTEQETVNRAIVIAHEMAHMWFGNLVTMRWWEDTWLNESFADYMGYRVARDGAGFAGTLVAQEARRKPSAYDADERRSTHPVAPRAEDVPDVDSAFANFDAISYAKGNSCLRQLVTWLGDEDFLAGVNAYLTRHRFGNATLADFVDALAATTSRDVRGWVELWLRRPGFDTLRVHRDGEVSVLTREGVRPHRVVVTAYDDDLALVGSRTVDLGEEPVRLDDWAGSVVVPNSHGETFARLRLDDHAWAAVAERLGSIEDDQVRAVLWGTAFDLAKQDEAAAADFLVLLGTHLPAETHVALVQAVVARAQGMVVPQSLPASRAREAHDRVAAACRAGLARTEDPGLVTAFTAGLVAATHDEALLGAWLEDGRTDAGVELDPALRWRVVARLAAVGGADEALIEAERARDGGLSGDLGAAEALSARPVPEAKAAAWARATGADEVSNRMFEALLEGLWDSERPDLVAPYVARYLAEGAELAARRGQAFSQVVGRAFPRVALDEDQLGLLRTALAGEVPTVLRRFWEDQLDDRTRGGSRPGR